MKPDHPAYEHMRLTIDALCTDSGSIHARLLSAVQHFSQIHAFELTDDAEWNLYQRTASSLVQEGDEDGTIAESIAALDESRAADIGRDMLHFFELVAGIADEDAPWRWSR
jgi:hypothetical protein